MIDLDALEEQVDMQGAYELETDMVAVAAVIRELRAARKVVEAARWVGESTWDLYPPGNWRGLDEVRASLADYDRVRKQ